MFLLNIDFWVLIGFLGQVSFFLRFFVQWIASEKLGDTVVPVAFWYLSILGGVILFAYAWHKKDPVFIAGQGLGLFIYVRNLHLINKKRVAQNKL